MSLCVHTCLCVHMCLHVHVCLYVCLWLCGFPCVCVVCARARAPAHMFVSVYVSVCVFVCRSVCLPIHVHVSLYSQGIFPAGQTIPRACSWVLDTISSSLSYLRWATRASSLGCKAEVKGCVIKPHGEGRALGQMGLVAHSATMILRGSGAAVDLWDPSANPSSDPHSSFQYQPP